MSVRSSRRFRPELGLHKLHKYIYQYSMTDRGRGVPGTSTGVDSRMSWYHAIRSRRGGRPRGSLTAAAVGLAAAPPHRGGGPFDEVTDVSSGGHALSGVHWAPVEWEWAVPPTGNVGKSVFLASPRRPAGGGGAELAGCAGIYTVIRNYRFWARGRPSALPVFF